MSLARFCRPVISSDEGELVAETAKKMRNARVGCVVVTRAERPIAIVTDRDLALRVVADARAPQITALRDVATYDPIVVRDEDGIETVLGLMAKHGVRRLPVVSEGGHLLGIVTADDLTVLLGRQLSELAEGIRENADATESR
ncbi:MAG: CBS domain-containing protein [Polyangiaceae bacterium]|nr:CBS domain-containing protein [Polyangiaceae bacterium]